MPVGPQLDYAELMSGEHGLDEYLRFSVSIGAVTSSRQKLLQPSAAFAIVRLPDEMVNKIKQLGPFK